MYLFLQPLHPLAVGSLPRFQHPLSLDLGWSQSFGLHLCFLTMTRRQVNQSATVTELVYFHMLNKAWSLLNIIAMGFFCDWPIQWMTSVSDMLFDWCMWVTFEWPLSDHWLTSVSDSARPGRAEPGSAEVTAAARDSPPPAARCSGQDWTFAPLCDSWSPPPSSSLAPPDTPNISYKLVHVTLHVTCYTTSNMLHYMLQVDVTVHIFSYGYSVNMVVKPFIYILKIFLLLF